MTVAAELVERACLNQTLYHALGAFRRIDAAAEVEDIAVYAVFAFADDGFYCVLPNGFDGTKAEENAKLLFFITADGELPLRTVDVRWKDTDAA